MLKTTEIVKGFSCFYIDTVKAPRGILTIVCNNNPAQN